MNVKLLKIPPLVLVEDPNNVLNNKNVTVSTVRNECERTSKNLKTDNYLKKLRPAVDWNLRS